jgi:hypothetical protein
MNDHDRLVEIKARLSRSMFVRGPAKDWTDPATHPAELQYMLADLDWLVGECERLRRFPAVWAVRYGNYDPSEVIALYDNEQAARAHAAMSDDPLEVEEMEVRSNPPARPEEP